VSGGGGDDPGRSSSVDLDADHDTILSVRVRRLDDIMAELDGSDLQLHAVSSDEPTSLGEAQADQNWQKAMKDEMASIEDNNTWCSVICLMVVELLGQNVYSKESAMSKGS
jgi:hypothetical protein